MAAGEKFDIKKFFDFGGIAWATTLGLGIKVFIIALLVLGGIYVKNMLFPPAPANVNAPEITVADGGTVTYTVEQHSEKKRAWWMPTPFVEVFGEMKTNNDSPEVGARFGGRWEF